MLNPVTRWDIYNFMKSTLMQTGQAPTRSTVYAEFEGRAHHHEIEYGIDEFNCLVEAMQRNYLYDDAEVTDYTW